MSPHAKLFLCLCYALVAAFVMVLWFLKLLKDGLATEPHPKWYKYVGTALTAFMLGAFWFITGPWTGISALVARFKK